MYPEKFELCTWVKKMTLLNNMVIVRLKCHYLTLCAKNKTHICLKWTNPCLLTSSLLMQSTKSTVTCPCIYTHVLPCLTHFGQLGTGSTKVRHSQIISKRSTHSQAGQYSRISTQGDHHASWKRDISHD